MDIEIREIENDDYNIGYMELMFEFTNYKYNIDYNDFCRYIKKSKENKINKILVIYSKNEDKIIGAGTIFRIEKIHNNPIGQIEDVIITEKHRGKNYGKLIINKLIETGKEEMKCYKIILNCLEKNIGFYNKCGFGIAGVEMKYL